MKAECAPRVDALETQLTIGIETTYLRYAAHHLSLPSVSRLPTGTAPLASRAGKVVMVAPDLSLDGKPIQLGVLATLPPTTDAAGPLLYLALPQALPLPTALPALRALEGREVHLLFAGPPQGQLIGRPPDGARDVDEK